MNDEFPSSFIVHRSSFFWMSCNHVGIAAVFGGVRGKVAWVSIISETQAGSGLAGLGGTTGFGEAAASIQSGPACLGGSFTGWASNNTASIIASGSSTDAVSTGTTESMGVSSTTSSTSTSESAGKTVGTLAADFFGRAARSQLWIFLRHRRSLSVREFMTSVRGANELLDCRLRFDQAVRLAAIVTVWEGSTQPAAAATSAQPCPHLLNSHNAHLRR